MEKSLSNHPTHRPILHRPINTLLRQAAAGSGDSECLSSRGVAPVTRLFQLHRTRLRWEGKSTSERIEYAGNNPRARGNGPSTVLLWGRSTCNKRSRVQERFQLDRIGSPRGSTTPEFWSTYDRLTRDANLTCARPPPARKTDYFQLRTHSSKCADFFSRISSRGDVVLQDATQETPYVATQRCSQEDNLSNRRVSQHTCGGLSGYSVPHTIISERIRPSSGDCTENKPHPKSVYPSSDARRACEQGPLPQKQPSMPRVILLISTSKGR